MTPPVCSTATAATSSGSITVRATDFGFPVELDIAQSELRFGGRALADSILELCARAALVARGDDADAAPGSHTPRSHTPWTTRA